MIETPHPVHTHGRSSFYIYKRFQHLEQWLRWSSSLIYAPRDLRVMCLVYKDTGHKDDNDNFTSISLV
jgi:hypothetical protein